MLPRNAIGVLAILTAWLSLATLARTVRPVPQLPPEHTKPAAEPDASALRALRVGDRLELNRASAADLQLLPGIGPALAQRIVTEREAHGPYGRIDDLSRVKGIGERTIARLRAELVVATQASAIEDPARVQGQRKQETGIGPAGHEQERAHVEAERPGSR